MVSYGIIESIGDDKDKCEIRHICKSDNFSSGSPLLNIRNNKVIGIHIGIYRKSYYSFGTFLNFPINEFSNDINLIRKNKYYRDEDFTDLKLISSGNFGDVFFAHNIQDKEEFCLKKINIEKMKLFYEQNKLKGYERDLDNEIKILKILSYNKNSVKYFGNYDNTNQKIIVMEKCDNNLKEFIKQRRKGLTTKEIKEKFKALNKLFKDIQENGIIHRDLKLENFLIKYKDKEKTDFLIKLCDYGIGKFSDVLFPNSSFSGLKGTIETIAPEIILEKKTSYDSIVDIYSLGIILYQLANNLKHPYDENTFRLVIKYNNNYENDDYKIEFDKEIKDNDFKDLILKMIKLNPKNRLNWGEYFSHKFFK